MLRIFVLALITVLPTCSNATTVIAFRSSRGVVVSFDSKLTTDEPNGSHPICKMFQAGDIYFFVAGLMFDLKRNFIVPTIIQNSLSHSATASTNVSHIEKSISAALVTYLRRLKTEDAQTYEFALGKNNDLLEILVIQTTTGKPYVAKRVFHFAPSTGLITIAKNTCPGADCPAPPQFFFLGTADAAIEAVKQIHSPIYPLQLLPKLVNSEIQAETRYVGPPVETVFIGNDGLHWISNDSRCPNIIGGGN